MNLSPHPIAELGARLSDATILLHQAIAARAGLSGTDHKYLGMLMRHGPMTAGELARHTGLTTGAVTGLIDRLAAKGLLRREFDASDRRKVLIVPDDAAIAALLGPGSALLQERVLAYVSQFPAEEVEVIVRYTRGMIDLLHDLTATFRTSDSTTSTPES